LTKILFTGDIFLGGDLHGKEAQDIVHSITFHNADKRIINLEQPISNNSKVADKCTLYTSSCAIGQLKELKIDAVNLAHNHIQDKEDEGIIETISFLSQSEIGHFGAGKNIFEAQKPFWINDELCVLGFCEFNRPYLKQIRLANEREPGVNPLRYRFIISELSKLPDGIKAILFLHWGREHVLFPPHNDILLAKKLLEDERVALIIGTHAHRLQGYVEHNGKRAYMCLGNFLFPNFFIKPPVQIFYPEIKPEKYDVTRQYLGVSKLTYKKWGWKNRLSIGVLYNADNESQQIIPFYQEDNKPLVNELNSLTRSVTLAITSILSLLYKLPIPLYKILEKINSSYVSFTRLVYIYLFTIKQKGLKIIPSYLKRKIRNWRFEENR
jgi:hypothetical protein